MIQLDRCGQVARRVKQKTECEKRGDGGEDARGKGGNRRGDKGRKLGAVNTIHHGCFAPALRQHLPLFNVYLLTLSLSLSPYIILLFLLFAITLSVSSIPLCSISLCCVFFKSHTFCSRVCLHFVFREMFALTSSATYPSTLFWCEERSAFFRT